MHTRVLLFAIVLAAAGCGGRSLTQSDGAVIPTADVEAPRSDTDLRPDTHNTIADARAPAPPPNQICATNNDCLSDEYCHRDGHCVVTGAVAGQCKPRPKLALCPDYDHCPDVCGCDGKTYCDACEAHAMGVSVATKAACIASTCSGLQAAYKAELQQAKQCCPICAVVQCVIKVPGALGCGCDTMINTNTPELEAIRDEWLARGCQFGLPPCGIKCATPMPGSCQGPTSICIDGD